MPDISVVILTYNSSDYIEKLLRSLISKYKKEIDDHRLEIIVADNNSSDSSMLKARLPGVQVFNNGDNFGFAKGINMAASHAKGEFLLFINPDSVFMEGDIFSLKDRFDEEVGIIGGKIISKSGKRELSCGRIYNFLGVMFLSLGLEDKLGIRFSPGKEKSVGFVSGAFMMIKRELFEGIGGFDENFFMYVEDMELCFRVGKKRLKILFSPVATIQHVGQASSNRAFAIVNIYKGLLYFHEKHMGKLSYLLVKLLLISKACLLVIIGKISNNQYLDQTYRQALKASV